MPAVPARRLVDATSPYLRAHSDNPVDWYPWGDEALERARLENRPILLSIGYAACHWCHVMAHESFSDPGIAEVMNAYFVNIKVDREERPDLDRIYQTAHAMLTRRAGGWPLTVFLNPDDLTPFFAGTYFPPRSRFGMPGFGDLLQRIARVYGEKPDEVRHQGDIVQRALFATPMVDRDAALPGGSLIERGIDRLMRAADREHGGFGDAPKFPPSTSLPLLLEGARYHADPAALAAHVDHTLAAMASGGLFDQVGGGFFRYCVDSDWTVPHFEKMLYDNAQLIGIYARAAVEAQSAEARQALTTVVGMSVDWLDREMRLPEGGLAASLDADSPTAQGESEEGGTYLWTPDEIRALLPAERARMVIEGFDLKRRANFEGRWHLVATRRAQRSADLQLMTGADRESLYAARRQRPQPLRDDKCLTGWNALTATGLLQAGLLHSRSDWLGFGQSLLDALLGPLDAAPEEQRRRLYALPTSRLDGEDGPAAFLDDLAWLLEAQWWALQAQPSAAGIARARLIADRVEREFTDPAGGGGYFLSSERHQTPMGRLKHYADDAWPSGNAVLAESLLRFGYLLGEPDWLERAEGILRASAPEVERMPEAFARMLLALSRYHEPESFVVVRGPLGGDWADAIARLRRRSITVFASDAADFLPEKPLSGDGSTLAYICRGTACLPPEDSAWGLLAAFA